VRVQREPGNHRDGCCSARPSRAARAPYASPSSTQTLRRVRTVAPVASDALGLPRRLQLGNDASARPDRRIAMAAHRYATEVLRRHTRRPSTPTTNTQPRGPPARLACADNGRLLGGGVGRPNRVSLNRSADVFTAAQFGRPTISTHTVPRFGRPTISTRSHGDPIPSADDFYPRHTVNTQ